MEIEGRGFYVLHESCIEWKLISHVIETSGSIWIHIHFDLHA